MRVFRTALWCIVLILAFLHLNSRIRPLRTKRPHQLALIHIDVAPVTGWPFAYPTGNAPQRIVATNRALATVSYYSATAAPALTSIVNWQQCANLVLAVSFTVFVSFTHYYLVEQWIHQRPATLRDILVWTSLLAVLCSAYASSGQNTIRSDVGNSAVLSWNNLALTTIFLAGFGSSATWIVYLWKNAALRF